MRSLRPRGGRAWFSWIVLAFAVSGLVLSVPVLTRAHAISAAASIVPAANPQWTVTWNTADVSTAGSATSALTVDFTKSANVYFNWSTGTNAVTINDARLQMFYFGYAVTTRDQVVNNPVAQSTGHIPLQWTPLSLAYVLEGIYKITASFLAPNGTTMFSENFYVKATALYGILAAIPIIAIAIVIYEIYSLVRSGRYAAMDRKATTPPPSTPPPTTSSTQQAPSAEPSDETPPASGGGS